MELPWYSFHVDAWRRDTRHLSSAERGIYRELLDEYMRDGRALPSDDRALSVIARCPLDEWIAAAPAVREFFKPKDGLLTHKRCEAELDRQQRLADRRSALGKHAVSFSKRYSGIVTDRSTDDQRKSTTLTKKDNLTETDVVEDGQPVDIVHNDRVKAKAKPNGASAELERLIRDKGWLPSPSHRPRGD